MTTRDDLFNAAPRIGRDAFIALFAKASPDVRATDPGVYYDALIAEGAEPLEAAAIFTHESAMASNPQAVVNRYGTHNPGNLRTESYRSTGTVQTDRGPFSAYATWADGFAALGHHMAGPLYAGLTIAEAINKWAPASDNNDPEAYIAATLDFINRNATVHAGGNAPMQRIIVQAGHQNIGSITADKIGQQSADLLRNQTGSLGRETELNVPVAQALVNLLAQCGFDAVATDATYHADIYGEDAALALAIHGDGVGFGMEHPQWCGAATVLSGTEASAADAAAQRWVDAWRTIYPAITGITDTHVDTNDMDYYYSGYYRSANTPMALVEVAIFGGSDGKRTDIPDVNRIAAALAVSVCKWAVGEGINVSQFATNLATSNGVSLVENTNPRPPGAPDSGGAGSTDPDAPRHFDETNQTIRAGFRRFFEKHGDVAENGFPLTGEFGFVDGLATINIQVCQKAIFEWHPELPADDPDFQVRKRNSGTDWLRALQTSGRAPQGAWLW